MYLFFHQDLGGFTAWTVISRVWAVVAATFIIIVPLVQEVRAYLGTQGVRVMNPPSLASGSHCRNIRTLCSRPPLALKIRGVRAQLWVRDISQRKSYSTKVYIW